MLQELHMMVGVNTIPTKELRINRWSIQRRRNARIGAAGPVTLCRLMRDFCPFIADQTARLSERPLITKPAKPPPMAGRKQEVLQLRE
jgi:hypothetical protein